MSAEEQVDLGAGAVLFKSSWQSGGVRLGVLRNAPLLSALNIVASDRNVIEAAFVDRSHAAQGFFAVRLWLEDPRSDDDWQIVLIDDRLPCGADGLPCFSRGAESHVFWVALLEKAIAKHLGSYAATEQLSSVDEVLEMVSTGKSSEVVMPLRGGIAEDAWRQIFEAHGTDHVVSARCAEHEGSSESGLVPGRIYSCLTSGATPAGALLRLRSFSNDPEWNGRWADGDAAWTSQLRKLLNYEESSDGTFWISFEDFTTYFDEVHLVRLPDDRLTRMSVKSRWSGSSAGGAPPALSWRNNYQWLLSLGAETSLTIQLTQEASSSALHAIGLLVLRGSPGTAARRRILQFDSQLVVASVAPAVSRRLELKISLPTLPDNACYHVVPHTAQPAAQASFSLAFFTDNKDGDGSPQCSVEPVRPSTDWWCTTIAAPSARVAAAPGDPRLYENMHLKFVLEGAGSAHVVVIVEQRAAQGDGIAATAPQLAPPLAPIGFLLMPNAPDDLPKLLKQPPLPSDAYIEPPQPADGVSFQCILPAGGAVHAVMPFFASGAVPAAGTEVVISVYSDRAPAAVDSHCDAAWDCPAFGDECPLRLVAKKMEKMEAAFDERIALLDRMLAEQC